MDEQQPPAPLEVIQRIYAAFADRDLDTILALVSPEMVLTQDPALPWGGRYEGHDGFGQFSLALLGAIDSTVTTIAMFQAGDQVVQYGRTAGVVRDTGERFDIPECHVWRVVDGKAVEAQYFIESHAMIDALRRE